MHPDALLPPILGPALVPDLNAHSNPPIHQGLSDTEEFDEECAWAPGSPTGHQGTDLMARKTARQSSPKLGDGKEHSLRGSPLARGSLEIPPHLKQITHEKVAKRTMQKVKKVAEMVEVPLASRGWWWDGWELGRA